jgi:hypothetical protein
MARPLDEPTDRALTPFHSLPFFTSISLDHHIIHYSCSLNDLLPSLTTFSPSHSFPVVLFKLGVLPHSSIPPTQKNPQTITPPTAHFSPSLFPSRSSSDLVVVYAPKTFISRSSFLRPNLLALLRKKILFAHFQASHPAKNATTSTNTIPHSQPMPVCLKTS